MTHAQSVHPHRVLVVIAILAAILFPVFAQAKAAAKNSAALSNVKQLGTAQMLYVGDSDSTRRGLGWNWGGGEWDDRAMSPVFFDGHAKRAANREICGRDDELNMWGYQRNRLGEVGAYVPGYTAFGLDYFCRSIPAGL